jgi:hypothetical protein
VRHKPPEAVRANEMKRAVIAGPDENGLGDALESAGLEVVRVNGAANRPGLEEAGIIDADLFVLTDLVNATSIPVAKDLNEDVAVVVYADGSLPEFVSGMEVLKMDPRLLGPDAVAEELAAT